VAPNKALQQTAATGLVLPGLGVTAVAAAAELGRSAREHYARRIGLLMNLLCLHVYHLDDGPDADAVIAFLTQAGVGPDWHIERPDGESNGISLPIELDDGETESWRVRQKKLEIAVGRLCKLRSDPINAIREMQLRTAMRIHTREFYLPLPSNFVRECGRLGLEICVLNEAVD
jgi:hypothetical protein